MAVNNQIIVKQFSSSITAATISQVWDFFEEAFTGLEGVTFKRDTTNTVMYIYLDDDKKMSVQIKMNDSNNGVLIEYWLGSEKCTYNNKNDYILKSTDISKLDLITNAADGSTALCVDTADLYILHMEEWVKLGDDGNSSVQSSTNAVVSSPLIIDKTDLTDDIRPIDVSEEISEELI